MSFERKEMERKPCPSTIFHFPFLSASTWPGSCGHTLSLTTVGGDKWPGKLEKV